MAVIARPLAWTPFLLAALIPLPASAIYRCGSVYQDKPCSNGEKEVVISPSGIRRESAPAAPPSAAPDTAQAKPKALPGVAASPSPTTATTATAKPAAVAAPAQPETKAVAAAAPAKPAGPNPACTSLRAQETSIKDQLRKGGTAAVMENYNQQRRSVEKLLSEAKC